MRLPTMKPDVLQQYQEKLTTPEEAVQLVQSGDRIYYGVNISIPYGIDNLLAKREPELENVTVGEGVRFNASQGYDSAIGDGASIGPFVHIRPGSRIGPKVHIGDFVEVKNSTVGEGTSVSHLTYVGDSDVGKYCNFGCGVVTVNYDGAAKHRNTIGDYAFIGCNTNLVAPVSVGDGAYTAAGSTITDDVPAGALGIARARQVNKPQWAKGKLEKFIAKQQAKEEAGSK